MCTVISLDWKSLNRGDCGEEGVPTLVLELGADKRISFTHTPDGDSVTAFDGREGWLGFPGRPAREMHGSEVDAAAMDADLHFVAHLKGMLSDLQVQGKEEIGDLDAYLVIGRRERKPPLRLYFDAQSGLLVRLVRYGETPLGRMPTQIDYADYREAGGVKVPFSWTLARPSGRFTIQVSEVKQNVLVDDAKFAKPPAPPEEKKVRQSKSFGGGKWLASLAARANAPVPTWASLESGTPG
jgi:hypothetical protein